VKPHDLLRNAHGRGHHHGPGTSSAGNILTGRHAALYDRFAAGWVLGRLYRAVAAQLVDAVPPGGSLLDVGTGPGRLLVEVARRRPDVRVVGVDPSADMVRHAQDRARLAGLCDRVDVQVAAGETLPFADASFDVVTSTLSAHHWADVATAVGGQTRVLRPGGQLFVYDLRRASSAAVTAALLGHFPAAAIVRPRLGRLARTFMVCDRATKGAQLAEG
jgi:ubiquinone/menaquinone biosynthesis C-methylase UbiE